MARRQETFRDGPGTPFETNPVTTMPPCGGCKHFHAFADAVLRDDGFTEAFLCDIYPDGIPKEIDYTLPVTLADKLKVCPHYKDGIPQHKAPKAG